MAAQNGHAKIVQTLLTRYDIDVNKPDEEGSTPLLTRDDININASMIDGQSSLFGAAESGHASIVTILLNAGTTTLNDRVIENSPIDRSCSGLTPLGIATQNNYAEVVQLLTQAGAHQ
jgi:ankyrin repeat protein